MDQPEKGKLKLKNFPSNARHSCAAGALGCAFSKELIFHEMHLVLWRSKDEDAHMRVGATVPP